MYFHLKVIVAIFCLINLSTCAPKRKRGEDGEEEEDVQLLDMFQTRNEDLSEFKYELSDGNMREETIKTDDLDNGIAVRGSYTIELADGEMQTIYYISDVNGHRISINKPFSDEEINRPRIAPQRRDDNDDESAAEGRNLNLERKSEDRDRERQRPNIIPQKARKIEEKPTRVSGLEQRPRVAVLPDRPKNVEFIDKSLIDEKKEGEVKDDNEETKKAEEEEEKDE